MLGAAHSVDGCTHSQPTTPRTIARMEGGVWRTNTASMARYAWRIAPPHTCRGTQSTMQGAATAAPTSRAKATILAGLQSASPSSLWLLHPRRAHLPQHGHHRCHKKALRASRRSVPAISLLSWQSQVRHSIHELMWHIHIRACTHTAEYTHKRKHAARKRAHGRV